MNADEHGSGMRFIVFYLLAGVLGLWGQSTAFDWKKAGAALAVRKDYRGAEEAFRKACAMNPREPDACFFWARTLYALDRFEESLAALDRAERGPRAVQARAQALDGLGRAAESEKLYRSIASDYRPARADEDPRLHFGVFLIRQGRAKDAAPLLDSLVVSHPTFAQGQVEKGRALMELGQLEGARKAFETALSIDPRHDQAAMLLGKVRQRLGLADR